MESQTIFRDRKTFYSKEVTLPKLIQRLNAILFFFLIYLFIFGCVGSLLLHVGFLQLQRMGATLPCGAQASHCGGFSCCGARALGTRASVAVAWGLSSCGSRVLECRLSSCGARAQLLRGMWDLPGPGLEPVSPALAGGLLTTVPPGKSLNAILIKTSKSYFWEIVKLILKMYTKELRTKVKT